MKIIKGEWTDERDGFEYSTVEIGGFVWLAENLAYKIPTASCKDVQHYGYRKMYGRLYNWEQAKEAVPEGWRLPLLEDWEILAGFVGREWSGRHLKAERGWDGPNKGWDTFGFAAMPGGYCDSEGRLQLVNVLASWWSFAEFNSEQAYSWDMNYNEYSFRGLCNKNFSLSVRLVKELS
jgi:uncharacterized protein (TIGR02145 family)